MSFLSRFRTLVAYFGRSKSDPSQLNRELTDWVDELTQRFEAEGLTRAQARRRALAETGMQQVREAVLDLHVSPLSGIWSDLHQAMRALWHHRQFSLSAIAVLTLGVGAGTAVFSFVSAVLLQPLPYKDPGRLTLLWSTTSRSNSVPVSWADLTDWRQRTDAVGQIAAVGVGFFTLLGGDTPEQMLAARVSPELFDALGTSPALGRTLRAGDDSPTADNVVLLGYNLWHTHFGARADVVGQQVRLNDQTYTIIGVMPSRFWFLSKDFQAWVPLRPSPQERHNRAARSLFALALLKPGATLQTAQTELSAIAAHSAHDYPASNHGIGVRVSLLTDEMLQNVRPTLVALAGAVLFLLLLSCVNLANLILTNIMSREREIAIRIALGGDRLRVARLFVTEAALIALIAGALGVLVALACIPAFRSLFPTSLPVPVPGLEDVRLNAPVLFLAFLTSFITAITVCAVTVFASAYVNPSDALRQGDRAQSGSASSRRRRMVLAAAEIALAVVLLVGAGLMVRSLVLLQRSSLGFTPKQVLTLHTPLPRFRYGSEQQKAQFYDHVLEQLRALPSVTDVGLIDVLPLSGIAGQVTVRLPGTTGAPAARIPVIRRTADAQYFRTMAIPVLQGRLFGGQDTAGSPRVAVVSESMVGRLWPSGDALSQTFSVADDPSPVQVIGIVGDVRHWVGAEPSPTFYLPYGQVTPDAAAFVLKTSLDPMGLAAAVEQAIWSIDPDQPVTYIRTFDSDVADQTWAQRLSAAVLGLFAIVALAVAATGIYGVMSASALQRSREIAIRVAIGANPAGIVRMILGEAATWIVLGIGLGVGGSVLMTRYLRSVLFEVTPTDTTTFGVVVAIAAVTAAAATYVPARRASRRAPVLGLNP